MGDSQFINNIDMMLEYLSHGRNKMKISIISRILLTMVILLNISPTAFTETPTDKPILLVWNHSAFKDQLADEILLLAEEYGFVASIGDSVKNIKKIRLMDYSGIIVLNTGMAGKMNRTVWKTVDTTDLLPPMFILTTFGDPSNSRDGAVQNPAVDCLTSPSLKNSDEIHLLARDIISSL